MVSFKTNYVLIINQGCQFCEYIKMFYFKLNKLDITTTTVGNEGLASNATRSGKENDLDSILH